MPYPGMDGTFSLTSLPKDGELSCEVRPPRPLTPCSFGKKKCPKAANFRGKVLLFEQKYAPPINTAFLKRKTGPKPMGAERRQETIHLSENLGLLSEALCFK